LGEDLILYRTPSGQPGLIGKRCAHRGVDMLYGIPEENGIRCCYHGWLYGFNGQCLEMPGEPTGSTFKDKVKIAGYPVQEMGGLIWAYLGPDPAPLLPRWGPFVWDNVTRKMAGVMLPCNWLQCVDNALDPTHFEHLHGYYGTWINSQKGQGEEWARMLPQRAKHHLHPGFERFEHGIIKRRVTHGIDQEHSDWRIGHPIIFPYTLLVGGSGDTHRFLIRVPVDDETTWYVRYEARIPEPGRMAPEQKEIPMEEVPLYDEHGRLLSYDVTGQDQMTWVAQGAIMDRTTETLGVTDAGIILYRRMLEEQIKIVEQGGDPINTFRDPAKNECILLPNELARFPGYEERGGPWATAVPRKPDLEVSLI
jgi:5,5'-dehydrodivanillate O-demethylase